MIERLAKSSRCERCQVGDTRRPKRRERGRGRGFARCKDDHTQGDAEDTRGRQLWPALSRRADQPSQRGPRQDGRPDRQQGRDGVAVGAGEPRRARRRAARRRDREIRRHQRGGPARPDQAHRGDALGHGCEPRDLADRQRSRRFSALATRQGRRGRSLGHQESRPGAHHRVHRDRRCDRGGEGLPPGSRYRRRCGDVPARRRLCEWAGRGKGRDGGRAFGSARAPMRATLRR